MLNEPTPRADLWVARRELTTPFGDRAWDRSGFAALDRSGRVVSVLPVKGVEANGGGGNPFDTVAWDVGSGQLWRGPELLASSRVSLVPPG